MLANFVDIDAAKAEFGETEFTYYRIPVVFSSGRKRGQEKHFVSGTKLTCSKEEYDAKHEEGERLNGERFIKGSSQFRRDYNIYSREVAKPGWREKLIELIQGANHE